jgi:hypothetical protein
LVHTKHMLEKRPGGGERDGRHGFRGPLVDETLEGANEIKPKHTGHSLVRGQMLGVSRVFNSAVSYRLAEAPVGTGRFGVLGK